jgi:hypothetical protein
MFNIVASELVFARQNGLPRIRSDLSATIPGRLQLS